MHICLRKRPLSRFEKGISLIALIITIIIIIILASIVIGAALGTPESAGKAKFLGSLSQIKEAVSIKRAQNLMQTAANPTGDRNYGFTKVMIKKTAESTAEDGWIINLENINIKNSELGAGYTEVAENSEITLGTDAPDVYICDAAGEVYYAKGYKDGEDLIYAQSYTAESEEPVNWALNTVTGPSVILDETFNDSASVKIYGKSEQVIPSGYTFYDYIQATGTQYINTNFNPNNNTRVVAEYASTDLTINNPLFGARNYTTYAFNSFSAWGNIANAPQRIDYNTSMNNAFDITINTKYKIDLNKNAAYINDYLSYTFNLSTFQCTKQLLLLAQYGLSAPETVSLYAKAKLYSCKIYDNGTLIRNLIPAKRNSDNAIGMYDLQNDVFYTNAGTGSFGVGNIIVLPAPNYLIPLNSVDNFDLVSSGKNFFNKNTFVTRNYYWLDQNGYEISNSTLGYNITYTNVAPNTQYTLSGEIGETIRVFYYNSSKSFLGRTDLLTIPTSKSFTTPGDCYFLRIGYRPDDYNINTWILEKGSTATEYEAFTSNSINFPYTLRSLSDEIKDHIEIDNINKTAKLYRNVGVRVYNGTENWIAYPGYTNTFYDSYDVLSDVPNRVSSKNSHFHYEISYTTNSFWIESSGHLVRITNMNFTTVNDFKTWLASEYANGTPVTVIYPLATPTVTDLNYNDVITYSPYTQIYINAIIKPNLEVTYKKIEI